MIKREAKFTTLFKKWLRANEQVQSLADGAAWEIKATDKDRILFSSVSRHQIDALTQVADSLFQYKIPDDGFQKPFDMITFKRNKAWIVLAFIKPRKPASTWIIGIHTFKDLIDTHNMKSLSEEELLKYQNDPYFKSYYEDIFHFDI